MTRLTTVHRWSLLVASVVVAAMFWLQLCDLVYACGCRAIWAGAAEHCNIHVEPSGSPHRCPWCVSPTAGAVSFLGTMGWFSVAFLRRWPRRRAHVSAVHELISRLVIAGMAIPVFVFGVGWISGAVLGYWT